MRMVQTLTELVVPLVAAIAVGCAADPRGGDSDGDDDGDDDPTGDAGGGDSDGGGMQSVCKDGLGAWTGQDNVAASQAPPCGLEVSQVPMFVSLGFDDNGYSGLMGSAGTGAMDWAVKMMEGRQNADGSPARLSFYLTSTYIGTWISESPVYVKKSWRAALEEGHELGNHTNTHSHGDMFSDAQWRAEIETCLDLVTRPWDPMEMPGTPSDSAGIGQTREEVMGFRTPFLEYNDATFAVVKDLGFRYDCSIEDGFQDDHDGTNYNWPYTLDGGSPGHDVLVEWGSKQPITAHPGLWEMPVHPVIVPPDDKCAEYGVLPGFRARMQAIASWFDVSSGKITGFDWNLWVQFRMSKAEFLATLKYTLDLRLQGNRAPLMLGVHTDYYSSKYTGAMGSTVQERQQAVEEFLDYALSKPEVRVASNAQILEWVRNPVHLP